MHKSDLFSLVSIFAAASGIASDTIFQANLATLFGAETPKILAALGLVGLCASQVLRVLSNPSPSTPSSTGVAAKETNNAQ